MQFLLSIDPAYAFSGLLGGFLVGVTGVGGGSLMTPLLVLLFGIAPSTAVGTDLLYAAITKVSGIPVHARKGHIDWRVTGWMCAGSLPAAGLTLLALQHVQSGPGFQHLLKVSVGVALVVTAVAILWRATRAGMLSFNGGPAHAGHDDRATGRLDAAGPARATADAPRHGAATPAAAVRASGAATLSIATPFDTLPIAGAVFPDHALDRAAAGRATAQEAGHHAPAGPADRVPGKGSDHRRLVATVVTGVVLGALVTLSSIGAGAVGTVALVFLYPRFPITRIVGTDIAHAVPLTLVAGLGHLALGHVDLALLVNLLVGSIPGIWLGAHASAGLSERWSRPLLAMLLLAVSWRMLMH